MDNNNDDFNSFNIYLWNKYELLQKELHDNAAYYQTMYNYFKSVNGEIDKHLVNISLLENALNIKIKKNKFVQIFNIIKDTYKNILKNHQSLLKSTVINIEQFMMEKKNQKSLYSDFKQIVPNYTLQQKKVSQAKDKYYESALEAETFVLKQLKSNESIEVNKKLKDKCVSDLKKYQSCIIDTNKKIEEYNSKQIELIHFYVNIEEANLKLFYSILDDFLTIEKDNTVKLFCTERINKLVQRKERKDIKKELKRNLEKKKDEQKPEELIVFEGHKSHINFDTCSGNEEFQKYLNAVKILQNSYNITFNDFDPKTITMKNSLRELLERFFNNDSKGIVIQDMDKEAYFEYLKVHSTLKTFVYILSKLRTKNKFNRGKPLIEILGESFKIVLEEAEKRRDFWAAKNCLILSQTFYYTDKDEKDKAIKIYPIEYIKKNTWIEKSSFWKDYCFWITEEELHKLVNLFKDITLKDIQDNKEFPKKRELKISEVIFSQLLTYITNLIDITHDQKLAIEIIELMHEKYKYLTKDKMDSLFEIISENREEIQKMRNEYQLNKNKTNLNAHSIEEATDLNEKNKYIDDSDYESSTKNITLITSSININDDKKNNNINTINDEKSDKDEGKLDMKESNVLEENNNIINEALKQGNENIILLKDIIADKENKEDE